MAFHFPAEKCTELALPPEHLFQQWKTSIRSIVWSCGHPPPQHDREVLPHPTSHRAITRRNPPAKLCKSKATPSLCGGGHTQILSAKKVLQSWNLPLQTCSSEIPSKSKTWPTRRSLLEAAWWVPAPRKKSRGHHKFGTFIYATDILKRKESKK